MDMTTILVEVIIFVSLIGVIATYVKTPPENLTGAAVIVFGLLTLFIVIGFVIYLKKKMKI